MDKFGNLSDLQKILWIKEEQVSNESVCIKSTSKQIFGYIERKIVVEDILTTSNSFTNNRLGY